MRNPFSRAVKQRDGFPVLPGAFPVVGHLPMVYRELPATFEEGRKLGPMFWITVGMWVLVCTGPDALEILKSKAFTSSHLQEISPLVAGESMLAQDGATHRHMRSAMNAPFLPRGLSASTFGPMSAKALSELTGGWIEQKRAKVLPDIQKTALEIIFRMIGVPADNLEPWRKQYRDLVLANLNIKVRFPGSPAVRAGRAKAWINARFVEIIAEARRSPGQDTLIGVLANARDEDDRPLAEGELLDNLRLLVLGGHETISSTMAWMVLRLASHPEVWDSLVEEARRGRRVPETVEEARTFPFAEAVFRETVRMHPALGSITRKAIAPFELHGRTIAEGTLVVVDLRGISHHESLFPEPEEYRPARWLGRKTSPSAAEISQFGAGPHFCLGYHLAWLEAVQFAVALAKKAAEKNLRPILRDPKAMRPIYLPTEHPTPKAIVDFV
jgi:cytochrome P450